MAIELQCSCGKWLRGKDRYAGRRVACPSCGEPLEVPALGASAPAAPVDPKELDKDLFAAAEKGDRQRLSELLLQGANPNAVGPYGNTPLHRAADYRQLECCEVLLSANADANKRNDGGHTPVERALISLLRYRASVQATFGPCCGARAKQWVDEDIKRLLTVFKEHGAQEPYGMAEGLWLKVPGGIGTRDDATRRRGTPTP